MASRLKLFALSAITALTLAACGGGDGDSSSGNPPATGSASTTIGASVGKGALKGALITVEEWNGSNWVAADATVQNQGDSGLFEVVIPQRNQASFIRLSAKHQTGAEMFDEASGQWTAMPVGLEMRSVLNLPANTTTLRTGINPYTEIAASAVGDDVNHLDAANNLANQIARLTNIASNIYALPAITADNQNDHPELASAMGALLSNPSCDAGCAVDKLTTATEGKDLNDPSSLRDLENALNDAGWTGISSGDLQDPTDIAVPEKTDARYGNGGEVLTAVNAFPLENPAPGYSVSKGGYFVFEVSDPAAFATAQFFTAGKLFKNAQEQGVDFKKFSFQTNDGWKTVSSPVEEARWGMSLDQADVLIACQPIGHHGSSNIAGSEQTIVAISDKATILTDLTKLYGKTLKEYTCGVDQEDWDDFNQNNKSPFEYNWLTKINAEGKIEVEAGVFVTVQELLSKDGYSEPNDSDGTAYATFATAYELNGKIYVLSKDFDEMRDVTNPSKYSVTLSIAE